MSGNHYSRQVLQLEAVVKKKLQQLTILEQEQQALVHKEHVLKSAIHGIAGSMAVKEALVSPSSSAATPEHSSDTHLRSTRPCISTASAHSSPPSRASPSAGFPGSQPYSSTPGLDARPHTPPVSTDMHGVLERLQQQEARVQALMQELGCPADSYLQLFTTQLLRRAVQDPQRAAGYLAMTKQQRLKYVAEMNSRMALLLGKYDVSLRARQQLDELVDALLERIIICGLLDPPQRYLNNMMVNLETHEFEPYPDGWWKSVVQSLDMTPEQLSAGKIVWERFKASNQLLLREFEQLQHMIQRVHVQQALSNRQFVAEVQGLPNVQAVLASALQMRQQQQQQQQQQQHQWRAQQPPAAGLAGCSMPAVHAPADSYAAAVQSCSNADLLADELLNELLSEIQLPPLHAQQETWCADPERQHHEQQQQQLVQQLQQQQQVQPQPAAQQSLGSAYGSCIAGQAPCPAPLQQAPAAAAALDMQPLCRPGSQHGSSCTSQGPQRPSPSASCAVPAGQHGCSSALVDDGSKLVVTAGKHCSQLQEAEEVLLQAGVQQQELECCMQACTNKMRVLHYCQAINWTNLLTHKQLATMFVQAHPLIPDAISLCEALDELGWEV